MAVWKCALPPLTTSCSRLVVMHDPDNFRQLVAAHQRRGDRLQRLRTIGIAAAAAIAVFLVAVLLDHYARLPMAGRALTALAVLGVWAWCGRFLWKWFVQQ